MQWFMWQFGSFSRPSGVNGHAANIFTMSVHPSMETCTQTTHICLGAGRTLDGVPQQRVRSATFSAIGGAYERRCSSFCPPSFPMVSFASVPSTGCRNDGNGDDRRLALWCWPLIILNINIDGWRTPTRLSLYLPRNVLQWVNRNFKCIDFTYSIKINDDFI